MTTTKVISLYRKAKKRNDQKAMLDLMNYYIRVQNFILPSRKDINKGRGFGYQGESFRPLEENGIFARMLDHTIGERDGGRSFF